MPGPVSSVAATFPGSSSTILSLSLSKPHPELVEGRTPSPLPVHRILESAPYRLTPSSRSQR